MNGCRTEFTQGGVNMFKDYHDDKFGERVLKVYNALTYLTFLLRNSIFNFSPYIF